MSRLTEYAKDNDLVFKIAIADINYGLYSVIGAIIDKINKLTLVSSACRDSLCKSIDHVSLQLAKKYVLELD